MIRYTPSPAPAPRPVVLVKVCGLTDRQNALACAALGVDWLGFNFHPASPRRVDQAVARDIVSELPTACTAVGLFVNRPADEVACVAEHVGLGTVQLHGDEPPEDLLELAHLRLIRAFRLGTLDALTRMLAYLDRAADLGRTPDAVLIDGYVAGVPGGTGHAIDVSILDRLPPLARLILAGGLTPENVAGRVATVAPWMVDVASGVESSPGHKDPGRVAAFLRASKGPAAPRA